MKYVIVVLAFASCRAERPLTVFAAASLRELGDEVAGEWTKRTGRPILVQYGASSMLARQIAEGAPCDLFLSADAAWAEHVMPLASREWIGNRLVVIGGGDLARDRVALASPEVPAGRLAAAALKRLGVTPTSVIYGADVRDVLSKVAEGAAPVGIVYATDIDSRVTVAKALDERTRYVIAVITPDGRELMKALAEPWAMEMARRRGFE